MAKLSPARARERAVFLYQSALERGDFAKVRAILKLAERDAILWSMIEEIDQLDSGTLELPAELPVSSPTNNRHISQVVTVHNPSSNGQTPKRDYLQEEIDMAYSTPQTFAQERPQTENPFTLRLLTLAASILIVLLVGGLLIEMVNHPIQGYPGLASSQTEEITPEATPACAAATDYMSVGEAAIIDGDSAAALAAYNCAIDIDPSNDIARFWRGSLAAADGDYDLAGADWSTAYNHLTPDSTPGLVDIARTIPTLNNAIKERPDDAVLYMLRMNAYQMNHLDPNALSDAEQMITLAPDNVAGYLIRWFTTQPQSGVAITDTDIQKALQIAPDSMLVGWILTWGMGSSNDPSAIAEVALPIFDHAIESNTASKMVYQERGIANLYLGNLDAVVNDFYQHIQQNQVEFVDETIEIGQSLMLDPIPNRTYRLTFTAQAGQTLRFASLKDLASFGYSAFPPTHVLLDVSGQVITVTDQDKQIVYSAGANGFTIEDFVVPESGVYTWLVMPNSTIPFTLTISG